VTPTGPFADAGANWRPMYCSLTSENVYLAKRASDTTCIDRIPLTDVTSVTAKPYPGQVRPGVSTHGTDCQDFRVVKNLPALST